MAGKKKKNREVSSTHRWRGIIADRLNNIEQRKLYKIIIFFYDLDLQFLLVAVLDTVLMSCCSSSLPKSQHVESLQFACFMVLRTTSLLILDQSEAPLTEHAVFLEPNLPVALLDGRVQFSLSSLSVSIRLFRLLLLKWLVPPPPQPSHPPSWLGYVCFYFK